mmetsp:Transcript_125968/g.368036  ORF Transcript_125968/g.368036 Transcript_125968/m.368036 type:complete len:139 (+) Transcript_125968:86-502(+)
MGGGGGGGGTLEKFVEENELSEAVASRLRAAPPDVQDRVIEQGWNVIDNARNADAVVVSRIRKHQEAVEGGRSRSPVRSSGAGHGGGVEVTFKEGDWYCGSCGAHNFARRTDCFKCNAPRDDRDRGRRDRDSRSRGRR